MTAHFFWDAARNAVSGHGASNCQPVQLQIPALPEAGPPWGSLQLGAEQGEGT